MSVIFIFGLKKNFIFQDFGLDFTDYIKYIVLYEKEKNKNGQTTAERERQKKQDRNTQAEAF